MSKTISTVAKATTVKKVAKTKPATKTTTKKVAQKKVAETVTEAVKVAETKVKKEKKERVPFDYKAVAERTVTAFKDNKKVDVIADSSLATPRDNNNPEYSYIHFFKKGTTNNMFGLFIKSKKAIFCVNNEVAKKIEGENFTLTYKKKKDTIVYTRVVVSHEDIITMAKTIIPLYE